MRMAVQGITGTGTLCLWYHGNLPGHGKGHSLCSTQDVLAQNVPMNRMQSPCRCPSFAKVRFYSIQINILVDLSILCQHFSVESVLNMSTIVTKSKIPII